MLNKKAKYYDAAAREKFQLTGEKLDSYCHVIDEEIDSLEDGICASKGELRNNNFDLSSFRPQKELNPKIWINGKINSKVRLRLLDIADDFVSTLEVDWVKPQDIVLTGSLANYNWSKFSDFDLHILIDFSKVDRRTNFVKDYFDSKKKIWNEQHENLKIYGFPVEVYVQDTNEQHTASGIYSLEKNHWIVEPHPNSIKAIKLNKYFIKEKVLKFIKKIDDIEELCELTNNTENAVYVANAAKSLFDKIKGMRRESLKNGDEMSSGNIIFKSLRRLGYIGKLVDIKTKTYDKINSIK